MLRRHSARARLHHSLEAINNREDREDVQNNQNTNTQ